MSYPRGAVPPCLFLLSNFPCNSTCLWVAGQLGFHWRRSVAAPFVFGMRAIERRAYLASYRRTAGPTGRSFFTCNSTAACGFAGTGFGLFFLAARRAFCALLPTGRPSGTVLSQRTRSALAMRPPVLGTAARRYREAGPAARVQPSAARGHARAARPADVAARCIRHGPSAQPEAEASPSPPGRAFPASPDP
jgi:hypothetical protein